MPKFWIMMHNLWRKKLCCTFGQSSLCVIISDSLANVAKSQSLSISHRLCALWCPQQVLLADSKPSDTPKLELDQTQQFLWPQSWIVNSPFLIYHQPGASFIGRLKTFQYSKTWSIYFSFHTQHSLNISCQIFNLHITAFHQYSLAGQTSVAS